jgi:hypothetical protein
MYATLTATALADDPSDHCSKEGATTAFTHGCCIHQLTTTTTKRITCARLDFESGVCIVACYEIGHLQHSKPASRSGLAHLHLNRSKPNCRCGVAH